MRATATVESQSKPRKKGPSKRKSIETLYTQIKTMMYNQDLSPGQKLILQDLARQLNVSTTPLLQALHRLENAKLVRYEQNKGFFVAEITETEARQLYQAREALEVYLIPISINKLTADKVEAIRESFRLQKDSTVPTNRRKMMLTDASFHLTIAKASGNQVMVDLLETVMERIYLKYRAEYVSEERIKKIIKDHRDMLQYLSKKDEKKTIQLVREHIRSGMEHMIDSLKNGRVVSL
ncbi:GntR family transcriptional regulator [Desulfosarcina widdelii]|uniref:GntR family transcriptional regulator n=1 Tax=Desulfosarcina widdelii TaxID=947919 RepID=A0A5K7Z1D0_9BACT|nr:GntR family transcriptional regulator [Desulfosarcina widdelii]BBO74515.1 GntR family transcriptional regulator [Desulfosarcina widdelii]